MEISLDDEQWTVRDDIFLIEALAQLSEKSRGKGRIVTSLRIGGRLCTDRDLVPEFLACSGEETGSVEASSTSAADILLKAQDTIEQFGKLLKHEESYGSSYAERYDQIVLTGLLVREAG